MKRPFFVLVNNEVIFMEEKKWEKRWEKYAFSYSDKLNTDDSEEKWLVDFLRSSIVLTNILIPSVVTFIQEFKIKSPEFDTVILDKKLNKFKRSEVEHVIKLFLMDYFVSFLDNAYNSELLGNRGIDKKNFENKLGFFLDFNKKEKELYKHIALKKDTYSHSILFFETLKIGKDAKNEALIDGVELIKETVFNKLDKTFQKFIQQ